MSTFSNYMNKFSSFFYCLPIAATLFFSGCGDSSEEGSNGSSLQSAKSIANPLYSAIDSKSAVLVVIDFQSLWNAPVLSEITAMITQAKKDPESPFSMMEAKLGITEADFTRILIAIDENSLTEGGGPDFANSAGMVVLEVNKNVSNDQMVEFIKASDENGLEATKIEEVGKGTIYSSKEKEMEAAVGLLNANDKTYAFIGNNEKVQSVLKGNPGTIGDDFAPGQSKFGDSTLWFAIKPSEQLRTMIGKDIAENQEMSEEEKAAANKIVDGMKYNAFSVDLSNALEFKLWADFDGEDDAEAMKNQIQKGIEEAKQQQPTDPLTATLQGVKDTLTVDRSGTEVSFSASISEAELNQLKGALQFALPMLMQGMMQGQGGMQATPPPGM